MAPLEPAPQRTARLVFVGDISAVANRTTPACAPALRALFASADLVIGNCESPVVERPHYRFGTVVGTRHAMTASFLGETLAAMGIAREKLVLSLANNHALDQGVTGLEETLGMLAGLGIRAVGLAAEPVAKLRLGAALAEGGGGPEDGVGPPALTVGLAAFTQWRNASADAFDGRIAMAADPKSWPPAAMLGCDLTCAIPHWDREFRHFPQAATRALARQLTMAGIGLVVGHHAHVLQPVERIDDTLIAYGLGDCLGTVFVRQPWPGRIGALLAVDVSCDEASRGRIAGYRLHPFFRRREPGRERLVPVEELDDSLRGKVAGRLAVVLGWPGG